MTLEPRYQLKRCYEDGYGIVFIMEPLDERNRSLESEPKPNNNLKDLIAFFSTEDRPVKPPEFRDFWNSLTETEKDYYKTAPLS